MITLEQYYCGRKEKYPEEWSPAIEQNAIELLSRVNRLLKEHHIILESPYVTSGWRPKLINSLIPNAAPKSRHMTGEAIDLYDPEGALDEYLLSNITVLVTYGLFMEHPLSTKGWCHLQSVSPKSGRRIFYP